MILIYDHRDIEHWEVGVDWEILEPDEEEHEEVRICTLLLIFLLYFLLPTPTILRLL